MVISILKIFFSEIPVWSKMLSWIFCNSVMNSGLFSNQRVWSPLIWLPSIIGTHTILNSKWLEVKFLIAMASLEHQVRIDTILERLWIFHWQFICKNLMRISWSFTCHASRSCEFFIQLMEFTENSFLLCSVNRWINYQLN